MSISVIIIDDEPPARKRIADLLRGELDLRLAAQCADGIDAQQALRQHHPDLVFLDIEIPEADGFSIMEALPAGLEPAVIFSTAHAEHAVRAFGVDAIDYLLKPYTRDRFRQALGKARAFLRNRSRPCVSGPPETGPRRLIVKDGGRMILLKSTEIDWIEAQGNYLALHVGKASHLLRSTLAGLEQQLPPGEFIRVSRSALVNLERIREIQSLPRGPHVVLLRDGQRIPLTRPFAEVQDSLAR